MNLMSSACTGGRLEVTAAAQGVEWSWPGSLRKAMQILCHFQKSYRHGLARTTLGSALL